MLKIILSFIILTSPLGLDWDKNYSTSPPPNLEGYVQYYGSVKSGEIVYVGTKELISLETEAQILFYNRKISEVLLVLGPEGLNSYNCLRKYKKVVSLISEKYGSKSYVLDEKDPAVEELIYFSVCRPLLVGLRQITTIWHSGGYIIEAKILGEYQEYFIEIRYIRSKIDKERKRDQKMKIMQKL